MNEREYLDRVWGAGSNWPLVGLAPEPGWTAVPVLDELGALEWEWALVLPSAA